MAGDAALGAEPIGKPAGVFSDHVALGLGLVDDIVGDRLDEEAGPCRVLHRAGGIEREQRLGIRVGTVILVQERPAQPQDVTVLDAAARPDLIDRYCCQNAHHDLPHPGLGKSWKVGGHGYQLANVRAHIICRCGRAPQIRLSGRSHLGCTGTSDCPEQDEDQNS